MGLKVDYVRLGSEETSNDWNIFRRIFDDLSKAAEITGI